MEQSSRCDTKTAFPLYYLADYFGNGSLLSRVDKFIEKSVREHNTSRLRVFSMYYQNAVALGHSKLRSKVAIATSNYIFWIESDCLAAQIANADFWLEVLDLSFKNHHEFFRGWARESSARLICKICENSKDELSPEAFEQLTCKEYLPSLLPESLLPLLKLESKIIDVGSSETPSCLQERCLNEIMQNMDVLHGQEGLSEFLSRHPKLAGRIMLATVEQSTRVKAELKRNREELEQAKGEARAAKRFKKGRAQVVVTGAREEKNGVYNQTGFNKNLGSFLFTSTSGKFHIFKASSTSGKGHRWYLSRKKYEEFYPSSECFSHSAPMNLCKVTPPSEGWSERDGHTPKLELRECPQPPGEDV